MGCFFSFPPALPFLSAWLAFLGVVSLLSFPSTSGAGWSGLRPSHVRDAMRPSSSDLLLRLLSEVVSLLLRGEVPEMVRPYVCGASIMALRKPDGSLRPIAIGETIRLCSWESRRQRL